MSVSALTTLAVRRDNAPSGEPVPNANGDVQTFRDVLVHAVPTEILAAYTAILAVVVGAVSTSHPRQYFGLRWALLATFVILTPLSVALGYFMRSNRRLQRKPWAEGSAATIAAAAWFLAMPGSPLVVTMHGSDCMITSVMITVLGGLLLTLIAPLLRCGSTTPVLNSAPPLALPVQAAAR